ncbi:hypothetical protein BD324DRAFT_623475 [Kockovaella imperatae]|uniref:Uncharacterized protein n=1 Tax=Kockovaella imperatae TaxID=4999 RepID=A0A1Y1UIM8_9TREE|nr:hypothetical protein BD324DRAFT_623475 [Kockovaella imperatae]ORX37829.1 hypothetical protein BD324DRAFT_623475 [Kockovaella imperatae]
MHTQYDNGTLDSSFQALSYVDIKTVATGLISAFRAEAGLVGKPGIMGLAMASCWNGGQVDLDGLAGGISNALAAAATAGYEYELAQTQTKSAELPVGVNQNGLAVPGLGWKRSSRLWAYSVLEILGGLLWLAAGIYMIGGGTRYDPSDWFQTINTSAGSDLNQIQGTCTGADHVGFSQIKTTPLSAAEKYGCRANFVDESKGQV